MLNPQGSIRGPWATGSDHHRITGVSFQRGLNHVNERSTSCAHPPTLLPPPPPTTAGSWEGSSPISERVAEVSRLRPGPRRGILDLVQPFAYRWETEAPGKGTGRRPRG